MIERWAPVSGFETGYEISTLGEIRERQTGRVLAGFASKGYLRVTLKPRRAGNYEFVHVLMLETFIGPRPDGAVTRHLNGDKLDNRLENLGWGTHGENMQDVLAHGTHPCSSKTQCKSGHPFTPENTVDSVDKQGRVRRRCRACQRRHKQDYKARQLAAVTA